MGRSFFFPATPAGAGHLLLLRKIGGGATTASSNNKNSNGSRKQLSAARPAGPPFQHSLAAGCLWPGASHLFEGRYLHLVVPREDA